VDVAVLDVNAEGEHRTPRRFPVAFRVQRTETVLAQKVTGLAVRADVALAVFLLLCHEGLAAGLGRRGRQRGMVGELEEILLVQQDTVVTTPGAAVDTLESQLGIELDDGLFPRVDLDATARVASSAGRFAHTGRQAQE